MIATSAKRAQAPPDHANGIAMRNGIRYIDECGRATALSVTPPSATSGCGKLTAE